MERRIRDALREANGPPLPGRVCARGQPSILRPGFGGPRDRKPAMAVPCFLGFGRDYFLGASFGLARQ